MATTIQVSDDVFEVLKQEKEEQESASYNETLRKILWCHKRQPSLAGFLGKECSMKKMMVGLRDKDE